jgi:hypothetical protein
MNAWLEVPFLGQDLRHGFNKRFQQNRPSKKRTLDFEKRCAQHACAQKVPALSHGVKQ